MTLHNIADLADQANVWLLGCSILVSIVVLWFFVRTRDGKARLALIAVMATFTLSQTLSFANMLIRQAGLPLDCIYIVQFGGRLITLLALGWLAGLLIGVDGRR